MFTYAIKWEEKILVTDKNKDQLVGYKFIQQKTLEPRDTLYKKFNDTLDLINSKYTENEQKSFDIKVKEAEKYIKTGKSDFLEALVIEGETVEELAKKIIENSLSYQILYATAEKTLREDIKKLFEKAE